MVLRHQQLRSDLVQPLPKCIDVCTYRPVIIIFVVVFFLCVCEELTQHSSVHRVEYVNSAAYNVTVSRLFHVRYF